MHKDSSVIPVEVKFTYLPDPDGKITEVLAVARDISKRKAAEQEVKLGTDKLLKAMEDTMQALARVVEMRDPYTAGHQRRVTDLACTIAAYMGLPLDNITGLRLAGLIHDIGKIHVPSEILTTPSALSEAEFAIIRTHPSLGYEILKPIGLPWPVADIVHQHHERIDGSGYPQNLKGENLLLESKILAVADVVEAIASHRPYRPALGIDYALEVISENSNRLYDSEVVDCCLTIFRKQAFTFQ
jgi:putative nucleotidyltransferase with HDIG domain